MTLSITVDGQQVPLDECGWLERKSCGCITAAVVAVSEGDWTIATADQAHRHFEPRKDRRARDIRNGYTYELITMAHYRKDIRSQWECAEHTPAT